MDVFSIYLSLKKTHGCFFFYLINPEMNTWMFVLAIYLSLKTTHGYFSHLLKPEENTCFLSHLLKSEENAWVVFFLSTYLSQKTTHRCLFSPLLKPEDNTWMFFLSIYLILKTILGCFLFSFT
jgi:hypothetical protein